MNWLSSMILQPIDLAKMYPADKPREYTKRETQNQDNFMLANIRRENEGTMRVIKALGGDSLTAKELSERMGGVKKGALNSKLKRMTEYGYLVRNVPPIGKGIRYSVNRD